MLSPKKKKDLTPDLEYKLITRLLRNMQEKEAQKMGMNNLDKQLMKKLRRIIDDNPRFYNKKTDYIERTYNLKKPKDY